MFEKKFISVIIPCYKKRDILEVCLPSLEVQSCKDFEIIIIDDCSPNQLYDDLYQYVQNSKLVIRLFQNDRNLGPGQTRNFGIQEAQGEYLMYVDSDDYVMENAIEVLKETIEKTKAECIFFDYQKVLKNKMKRCNSVQCQEGFVKQSEAIMYGNGSTWSKIFKTSIVKDNNIFFADIPLGEDFVYTKLALLVCKKIYYIQKPLYFYVDQEESLMKSNISGSFASVQWNLIENRWPKNQMVSEKEGIYIYLIILFGTWSRIKNGIGMKELKRRLHDINVACPNWNSNKYILSFQKYQQIFLYAIRKEKPVILKCIVLLRDVMKNI